MDSNGRLPSKLKPTTKLIELQVKIKLYDRPCGYRTFKFLLDTGASSNFISKQLVEKERIPCIRDRKVRITTADGTVSTSSHRTQPLKFHIGSKYCVQQSFIPMNLNGYAGILGMPFINQYHVSITGGFPTEVTVPYQGRTLSLPILMYQDHRNRLSENVKLLYSENEVRKELIDLDNDTCFLLAPVQYKNKAVDEAHIVMEAQPQEIEDKVREVAIPYQSPLRDILNEFKMIFPADLPIGVLPDHPIEHAIVTDPTQPIPQRRPYKTSSTEDTLIETTLKYLLDHGLIRESDSPYASPVLVVPKKDGTFRFCTDYRILNRITRVDKFPILRIDDLCDQLRGASIFSKMDLRSGYWQVRIKEEDVEKTTFRTKTGHYEWLVMPFGLTNAPATFQRLVTKVLKEFFHDFACVYLDDIIIYSKTPEEHKDHLRKVFQKLAENSLYAKLSKCIFYQQEVDFLGHIVNKDGVHTDPKKVQAMVDWPVPKNLKELRGFLGLCKFLPQVHMEFRKSSQTSNKSFKGARQEWTSRSGTSRSVGFR